MFTKKIHNVLTGEILEVAMSDNEIKQLEADNAEMQKNLAAKINQEKIKSEAYLKLAALGLTTEDLVALGL